MREALLLPEDCLLNDDVLLDTPSLLGERAVQKALSAVDQQYLMALVRHIRKVHPMGDEITRVELLGYLDRMLAPMPGQPRNWAVQIQAMHMRSAHEINENHQSMRALLQLEEIVLYLCKKDAEVPCEEVAFRMNDLYSACLPSAFELKRSIADVFFKTGLFKSALDIYQELNDQERLIESYINSGRKTEAEEVGTILCSSLNRSQFQPFQPPPPTLHPLLHSSLSLQTSPFILPPVSPGDPSGHEEERREAEPTALPRPDQ